MLPNTHAKQERVEYRCAALCKNKPTIHADSRITDIDPTAGQRIGEWHTVEYCTRHWNEIRSNMKHKDDNGTMRGYTESQWGDIIQVVEYAASWPIL
jgi:hypothetical protein